MWISCSSRGFPVVKWPRDTKICRTRTGMDPAWSGRGGGCSASSGAELCRSCVLPAHQLASLLQNLARLLYLNCNCCSQFAYHHVVTQITVSHFASNNFLLYHEKIAPPCAPSGQGWGAPPPRTHPPTPVNPSLDEGKGRCGAWISCPSHFSFISEAHSTNIQMIWAMWKIQRYDLSIECYNYPIRW
jgi:hypothetical protein